MEGYNIEFSALPGAVPALRATVDTAQWRTACGRIAADGGRLVALWGSDDTDIGKSRAVHAAYATASGLMLFTLPVNDGQFPDISDIFPAAIRMQRATRDLSGLAAAGATDNRQWLRHAAWPVGAHPLRKDYPAAQAGAAPGSPAGSADAYPFVQVSGDGVHEIPVGPVHAGTIEPGHFRFSIVGERVLRLEERLGYKHKGIEKRFEQMDLIQGARLAGRISGDSTVAYAWAYAMAVEGAAGLTPLPRASWLRALLLERERIANHLGDLGALGNDAGLGFGLAQFSCLKEDLLRLNQTLFGHRYLMDVVIPGGVACDPGADGVAAIRAECATLERAVATLRSIYDEHPGLQDRFITCGRVAPELAAQLGLIGLAGRASGLAWDLRLEYPCVPYAELDVNMATHRNGDVAARVIVRFEEIVESLRLIRMILERMPLGECAAPVPLVPAGALGAGWVEGWRGEVFIALETGPDNRIRRLHPHDPSWQNWPLLEHAVLGNIVPDFPLINKSFNLSYSGHDL
ncbi:MAG: NADH-quinone oxidoreductase subunit C [Burkholderiales bacterium]|nr:NADH-quinone oxidoreductase subunit C [Burkholderiales bacterium]